MTGQGQPPGDRDEQEERVRALMRRSDGPVLIRPLHAPAATHRSSVGPVLAAGLVALIVVTSAVAGLALNARRQDIAASPQPTSAISSVSPSAATIAPDAQHMLVVNLGGHGIGIRTEADPSPFFRVQSRTLLSYAVGPNGKLAYWKTGADDALPHELHVYDAMTGSDRTLLTLTDERGGSSGFMVWSTDGSGIAFGTSDTGSAFEGRLSPSRPKLATWSLLDVGSGVRRKIATTSGAWFMPVSWDRATDAASAIEYGRDGPSTTSRLFYVWDPQHVPGKASLTQLPASIEPFSVHSDTSARAVLGLEPYQCGQSTCRNLWIWDPTDPTAAVTRKIPGRVLNSATFRPGSLSIFAMLGRLIGDDGPTALVELGPPSSSMLREVYTPLRSSFVFRADGTAIVLGSYNFTDGRGLIVDPDTGASTGFTDSSVENVIAGIGSGPPRPVVAPSGPPGASPSPTPVPAGFATVEDAADAAKRALQGDPQLLYRLVRPAGWYAQWYEQGKTDPMSLGEAVNWLTAYPEAKRTVDARPLFPTNAQHPAGEAYVSSLWLDFGGYPEQKADIMLGQVGGRWFWTSVLLYRPPPIGPGQDTFNGYSTLQTVTDTTITVRFRALGSRCCSDPSWNGRTVTLRRDRTTWMRAGGVVVPTLEATGAVVGSDVWVQFAPSTLAADGTYRLSDFAKMYP